MGVLHQMGHHSGNLVFEEHLEGYVGQILSPVNESPASMAAHVVQVCERLPTHEVIFDPQLYMPQVLKGKLCEWPYYPSDSVTRDPSDMAWWDSTIKSIVEAAGTVGANLICSPAPITRHGNDLEYHAGCAELSASLKAMLKGSNVRAMHTALVHLQTLDTLDKVNELASVITKSSCKRIYLIFDTGIEPRREVRDVVGLLGGMRLIRSLTAAGKRVTVGMCSSDHVLWKSAGAQHCATGKFFNLRRFTRSRWEESADSGGGQLAYWFEEGLFAFLREADLIRCERAGLLSEASLANPYSKEILELIHQGSEHPAWVAESWRFYMWWFMDLERRIEEGLSPTEALKQADSNWVRVDNEEIIMDERQNDGGWVRNWRQALSDFKKDRK